MKSKTIKSGLRHTQPRGTKPSTDPARPDLAYVPGSALARTEVTALQSSHASNPRRTKK